VRYFGEPPCSAAPASPSLLPVGSRDVDWAAIGYVLAGSLEAVRPDGVEEDDWWARLATLAERLDEGDVSGALRWRALQFPALVGVPRRDQLALVRGLAEAAGETDIAARHP
jgi:hypothetical protein